MTPAGTASQYGSGSPGGETAIASVHNASRVPSWAGFVALMGPSGAGKSTLLAILGAMSPPTSGTATVHDLDVYGLSAERLADVHS